MGAKFSAEQIPDQSGKVAIVTGANSGIGKVTALELARKGKNVAGFPSNVKGCKVYLAGRSQEKTQAALEDIKKETGNENVWLRNELT